MAQDEEEDDPKFKMGRLIEEEKDPLFRRGTVSFTRFSISLTTHRTVKARWKNIRRGRPGTATFSRRSGWTDYQDRTGRFADRPDLLGTYGDDRTLFAAGINATKDQARRYNDAIMLTGFFPVPKELSLAGQLAIMRFICDDVRATGRLCCGALHDSDHGNRHFHVRATSRPVVHEEGVWRVGKGKFIDGPAEMHEWREKFCAFVNSHMDREGLTVSDCRRFYPGPLSDLTGDQPARRWVSARAFLRDDPDLSRPEDQFSIVWNACIDRGQDPNKDAFIIEMRAKWAKEREEKRAQRAAAAAEKAARRRKRIDALPEVRQLEAEIAQLKSTAPAEPLSILAEDYKREVERAHKKNGTPLSPGWQETEAKRAAAEAIRADVARREADARRKADARAAKRTVADAKAREKAEEEESAKQRRLAEEEAQRASKRAAKELDEQASRAKQDEENRKRREDLRLKELEDTAKYVIPDAKSIAGYVTAAKGVLRVASDDVASRYRQAHGKVARSSEAAEFLSWQDDRALRWIYVATVAASKEAAPNSDENDVLVVAKEHLDREIKRRGHEPDKFAALPPQSAAPGGGETAHRQQAPKEPAPKKSLWPWSNKKVRER